MAVYSVSNVDPDFDGAKTAVSEAVSYAQDACDAEKYYRVPRVLKDVLVRDTKLGELEGDSEALRRLESLEQDVTAADQQITAFDDVDAEQAEELLAKLDEIRQCVEQLEAEYRR